MIVHYDGIRQDISHLQHSSANNPKFATMTNNCERGERPRLTF